MENTIVSISTSIGGAISIIRVSGKDSILIVNKIFSKDISKMESHTIKYGYIKYNNEIIDEVLLSIMREPKTYTCENLIEINCHGGMVTTNKILNILLEIGCILAEPGEFTKRAFLNGRIDLTKAEAVNDLINSSSESARKMNINAVSGKLYEKINRFRNNLSKIISNIEVNIDYPEYTDELNVSYDIMDKFLEETKKEFKKIIKDSENAKIIKNGINIAIIGKPNVGKSSLLNIFLGEDKAIVTNVAGTTRDIVEGSVYLEGILVNFVDTAGIRETTDIIEKIGVEKSIIEKNKADYVILVLNNNDYLNDDEIKFIQELDVNKSSIFVNKSDLKSKIKLKKNYILGNTIEDTGIELLKKDILNKLNINDLLNEDLTYLGNTRQIELMKKAEKSINSAIDAKNLGLPIDLIEIDIKNAWEFLGQITGEFYENELVDNIFSNFCLGK